MDFDELLSMSDDDRDAFRRRQVEILIESAPDECRDRLRGVQSKIDMMKRKYAKNPLGLCVALSRMTRESISRLNQVLETGKFESGPKAKVISLSERL